MAGRKPIVLVSPLDWGLGHTVRCIPIIQELVHLNCTVIIACNSVQKSLLTAEFPQCTYVHLPGYDLRYGRKRWTTILKIGLQLPKILIKINKEHRWLTRFLKKQPIHLVISDNRFGLYARSTPTVFITHQLHIKTGLGRLADALAQRFNYRQINRFGACWVPDFEGEKAMAGYLSNPNQLPNIPVQYIGGLSRLKACTGTMEPVELLIILSGPEPQRSIFEQRLLSDLQHLTAKTVLVRGLPGREEGPEQKGNCIIYNHAPAALLNKWMCAARFVISRPGYTTVMDLLKLGKKSIFVPTPGQAEQEYLAQYLLQRQWAYTVSQTDFSLLKALEAAESFQYKFPVFDMEAYKRVIGELFIAP